MIEIVAHPSSGYKKRTEHNASQAGVTVAFAVDFETAGERLTRRAAGDRYLGIGLDTPEDDPVAAARLLYSALKRRNARSLNIAGNGVYTLIKHGWDQHSADAFVHAVVAQVHLHWPLEKIVSGGQTGIDLAGAVAAQVLGIPAVITLPGGFRQRHEDGVDREHTQDEIREQILSGAQRIELLRRPAPAP